MDDVFHLEIWQKKDDKIYVKKERVRHYFELFFEDSGMTFEQIIQAYHCNPSNILNRYNSGSAILKD